MNESLIDRIKEYATSQVTSLPYAVTPEEAIGEAERRLAFPIPTLLKACYLRVGNGGFGLGYGIIGVEGGYASDHGNLVEIHEVLKEDHECEGRE